MEHKGHYEKTKDFFRLMAIERQGYYNAQPGGALKHSIWQLRIRKMALRGLSKLLWYDSNISKVLDVGCGRGDFTIEIAKRHPQLGEVWGCDFSEEVLAIARKDAASSGRISFQEADLLDMPFQDNSFDLTLCVNVLHHVHESDLARALSELARITNRYLVIEIRNSDNFYYRRVHSKTLWIGGPNVYPTSTRYVSSLLGSHSFRLRKQQGIFLFNWLSPLVLLIYDKQTEKTKND